MGVVGDSFCPGSDRRAALDTGEHVNKVPIIVGTNKDEYKLYTNTVLLNALPDFTAIELNVELMDSSAKLTADAEVWTLESVLADIEANLVEPTKSAVLLLLGGFIEGL